MVAYSFQKQFADPILMGRKTHTIRAARKRHAKLGEQLQLYTGMRTKQCRLIARATCSATDTIVIYFDLMEGQRRYDTVRLTGVTMMGKALDEFAYKDGFGDWTAMRAFWHKAHGTVQHFTGVIIYWTDLVPG